MVVLLVVLLLPISVSAGLVGAISSIFFKDPTSESLFSNKNVQNMSLLVATAATPSQSLSHAPTVEDNALVYNAGPSGATLSGVAHKPTSDQISIYVVREGDTLSQIAEMFDVTVNTIKWGNDLSSNTLKEGQTLIILPISGVKHTVVKGDTVASLVKKYKGDKEEILAYNNLDKDASLLVGSIIIIPDGEAVTTNTSTPTSSGLPTSTSQNQTTQT